MGHVLNPVRRGLFIEAGKITHPETDSTSLSKIVILIAFSKCEWESVLLQSVYGTNQMRMAFSFGFGDIFVN